MTPTLDAAASFLAAYLLLTCVHEVFHIAAACLVGHVSALSAANLVSATCSKSVSVPGASGWRAAFIKHAGWVGSALLAAALSASEQYAGVVQAAAWLTALDAACSDLLGLEASARSDVFHCGNFGLVIISKEHRDKVFAILKEMVRITSECARGGGCCGGSRALALRHRRRDRLRCAYPCCALTGEGAQ